MKAGFNTSRIIAYLPEAAIILSLGGAACALASMGGPVGPGMIPFREASIFPAVAVPASALVASGLPTKSAIVEAGRMASFKQPIDVTDSVRVGHAHELLGKFYDRSVVRAGEQVAEVDTFVRQWTTRALKPKFKKLTKVISETVLRESERNGFDPVFLMAVIENESSFNPRAVGPVGEIGLMQVTAETGKWISGKFKFKWHGKKTLLDPQANIRIGAAYLGLLREQFDNHSRLYLAAYNMGARNVKGALERSIWPKDYPMHVMKRYIRFYSDIKSELKGGENRPKT
jgi:soluble lytic murein transglycosylase